MLLVFDVKAALGDFDGISASVADGIELKNPGYDTAIEVNLSDLYISVEVSVCV